MSTSTSKNQLNKSQRTKLVALPTTSARIRYLTGLDWTRSQISKELGILYQHVRNVQITPIKNQRV